MNKKLSFFDLRCHLSCALLGLLITLQGCSAKNSVPEQALAERLTQYKTDNTMSMDLRTIFGIQWKKVCLQGPYELQSNFEKSVGEKISGFEGISDDRYALWVFYSDGHKSRVDIEIKIMGYRKKGTTCTSIKQPFLYFDVHDGEKMYFLNNTGDMK